MFGLEEIFTTLSALRNISYDSVFHVGDTALQFTADLIRGPDDLRYEKYAYRQIEKQQRQIPKTKAAENFREKPLRYEEKQIFSQLMQRQQGETVIEHWKRQKMLLNYPNKHQLIGDYQELSRRLNATQKSHDKAKLEEQFKALSRASIKSHKNSSQRL